MIDTLKRILEKKQSYRNPLYIRNLCKEELQNYILSYIYNSSKYRNLIFTGGTCLRKIYGLPRLSEDLDFDFTTPFSLDMFSNDIQDYFMGDLQYKNMTAKNSSNENTIFIKFQRISL